MFDVLINSINPASKLVKCFKEICQPQVVMSALSQIEMSAFEHKLSPVKHRGGYWEDGHPYESKGSETWSTIGFIEG